MKTTTNHSYGKLLVVLLTLGVTLTSACGQITAVSPDSAAQGTTGLTVTITLDADADPPILQQQLPVVGNQGNLFLCSSTGTTI